MNSAVNGGIFSNIAENAQHDAANMADWQKLAEKALKGASLDSLHTQFQNIAIAPLYAPHKNAAPVFQKQSGWSICQRIDDVDPIRAASQALTESTDGADSITLLFEGGQGAYGYGLPSSREAMESALAGLDLSKIALRIDAHPRIRRSADWLADFLSSENIAPRGVTLGIDYATILGHSGRLGMSLEALRASMGPSMAGFFALGVPGTLLEADGRAYHNAGATIAQELGAMLSASLEHFRMFKQARQPLVSGVSQIGFATSTDQNFLISIAKLRALHILWRKLQQSCAIENTSLARIHVETSRLMLQSQDCGSNILRNTIAVNAAALGGVSSISVLPHTLPLGLPDPFARRIARNIQLIARDEAHLGDVSDVAAGSGAIEAMTDRICEASWAEFQRLENEGGILESLRDNHFQTRIAKEARKAVGNDKTIIGVTKFQASKARDVTLLNAERREPKFEVAFNCTKLEPIFESGDKA